MYEVKFEIWLNAERERVFEALTTEAGLDGWWGTAMRCERHVGGIVEFDHGLGVPLTMEVTDFVVNERVVWRCVSEVSEPSNPLSEWNGQTFVFEVDPRREVELLGTKHNLTVLHFRNEGWAENARWAAFCSAGWGETLAVGFKKFCEAGADWEPHPK